MSRFRAFVILGTMRTGSNFLEASLSEIDGIACFGELFNPKFIGKLKQDTLFDYDLDRRESDHFGLLETVISHSDGLPGFRLFNGHDPRVLAHVLDDATIAKIVLRRDPAYCYLSLRHANATEQWRSGDFNRTRSEKVTIERAAFTTWRDEISAHYAFIEHALRSSGQTPFAIDYDELHDVALLNGIAKFFGVNGQLESASNKIKKQIADPPSRRHFRDGGPGVNRYLAADGVPLLYVPIRGGTGRVMEDWFAALGAMQTFNRGSLKKWRQETARLRSFTIVRHPMDRLIALYFSDIRSDLKDKLERRYGVKFSPHPTDDDLVKFARIVRATAASQTSMTAPPGWAPQSDNLRDLGQLAQPDRILRDEDLSKELAELCASVGTDCPPLPTAQSLSIYHSEALDAEVHALWGEDYLNLGYAAFVR